MSHLKKQMPSFGHLLSYLQNRQYPVRNNAIMMVIPHGILDSRSMINIPAAIQISANPISRFKDTSHPPSSFTASICCCFQNSTYFSSAFSASSRISDTSASVTLSSFFSVNRSTRSGTISRILVIVS